jgi:hypothetical protein
LLLFLDIVDIKPANMEDLDEVITCCAFSPNHPSHLMYTTSKGFINLCDMRKSAICDSSAISRQPSIFFGIFYNLIIRSF